MPNLRSRLTLAQQFMIASLIVLAAGAYGVGRWVSREIEAGVIDRSGATAALYVESFVEPSLQTLSSNTTLPPEDVQHLDWLLTGTSLGQQIASFKVWDTSGKVVYSTDQALVGTTFPIKDELEQALRGNVTVSISNLNDAENITERDTESELIEVYIPVRERGNERIIAVAEFYQATDALRHDIAVAKRNSWLIVGGATLGMYLLLAGFVQRASNTIERQQRELGAQVERLSTLLHQNEALHERVRRAAERTTALNERFLRRFSAELHDGPAQDLSLALLKLDTVIDASTANGASTPAQANAARDLALIQSCIQRALVEVRSTSAGVLLPQLNSLTLEQSLAHVVRIHTQRTGSEVVSEFRDLPAETQLAIKIAVYRFVQEALQNAWRHAEGQGQRITAVYERGMLTVAVADRGPGFSASGDTLSDEHLGLVTMRERIESLGGSFRIESSPGNGTTVIALLPHQEAGVQA